jgi:tol-pal system protein YbgF
LIIVKATQPPRARWSALALAVLMATGLGAGSAQAGLFDDEEARKAIVELRLRVSANEDAGKARNAELAQVNAQLAEQLGALRRSLLDLNNQLEAMRGELARLRGADEQLVRDVAELQKRQRDIGQTFDDRVRKLEPIKVTVDGKEHLVEQEEKRAFDEALAVIRTGDFDKATNVLANFLRRYVGSPYTDQARFWHGNALYGKREYKDAITAFRNFVTAAPEHPRAPEALLAVANSQAEMKDPRGARKTIEELMKAYPQSEAAAAGKERLASIK